MGISDQKYDKIMKKQEKYELKLQQKLATKKKLTLKEIRKALKKYKVSKNSLIWMTPSACEKEIRAVYYHREKNILWFISSNYNYAEFFDCYFTSQEENAEWVIYNITKHNGWVLICGVIEADFPVTEGYDGWSWDLPGKAAYICTAHVDSDNLQEFYDINTNSFIRNAQWETKETDQYYYCERH